MMSLKLIDKDDCSTKGGTRKTDREKLEAKKKEISTEKEIIRTIRGQKYRYLIYWDKKQNRQRQKCLGKKLSTEGDEGYSDNVATNDNTHFDKM